MLSRRSLFTAGGLAAGAAASGAVWPARAAGVDWERLRARLRGALVLPRDADYERAKQVQIVEFDAVRPRAIAYCVTPEDVRECVLFARRHDIRAVPRSGGHNFAGWSTTEGGLVIDLSRMNRVAAGASTVFMGPGAQSVDVMAALRPYGVQVINGLCPTVCAGGFLTGGGIGWQTRKFGLGSDRMVSARVVLSDGRVVRCSAEREPDLFWALRGGGGGNFGVVVDFEVRPTRVPVITSFTLSWSWDHALDVLAAWQRWSVDGSVNLNSSIGAVLMDARPGTEPSVLLQGGYLGPRTELDAALDRLYAAAGARPAVATVDELPYDKAMMRLYGCADVTVEQCHRVGQNPEAVLRRQGMQRERHRLFDAPLDAAGLDAALTAFLADRRPGQLRYLGFTALGGEASRPGRTETAYVHRDALFLIRYTLGMDDPTPAAEDAAAAQAWVDRGFGVLDPRSNGHSYINFPDPSLRDWAWSYHGVNHPRLLDVRRRYDPAGFFRHPQSVGGRTGRPST
ncbi:FAD-dependent oxidoreductase [Streptomyces sp. UNOB3_S3]|nr:FAD-dependent oxidoreductase [Streptomyces sp. UNOB3_S3]